MKKIMVFMVSAVLLCAAAANGPLYAASKGEPIWCTPPATLGQSKGSIKSTWGEPDEILKLGTDETGLEREAWIYTSKPFGVLSQNAYVCQTQRLIFTGRSLTKIVAGKEPLPVNKMEQEGPVTSKGNKQ